MNRGPLPCDRLCDECGDPMIGIMEVSGIEAPRRICYLCDDGDREQTK